MVDVDLPSQLGGPDMSELRPGSATGLRVAAITGIESVSGPGRQLASLAQELRAAGAELRVLIFRRTGHSPPPIAEHLVASGVAHEIIADDGPLDHRLAGRAREVLARWRPHVMQTHGYKATAVAYALRRTGTRTPWIGYFHGATTEDLKARFYHQVDRFLLGGADRVIVMSELHRHEFRGYGDRVRVIHNAVIPIVGQSEPEGERRLRELLASLPRPRLAVIGRLSPEKGVDVMLHACALLQQRGFAHSLLIAGEGAEQARLESMVRTLALDECVKFIGHVHNVRFIYEAIDLLVIPSRSEGLPNVLLEALGHGRPVVATRVGAVPEVLTDAVGVIVPPGSPEALAQGVVDVLARPASGLAEECRSIAERLSPASRAQRHLELYHELVSHANADGNVRPVPVHP